MSGHQRLQTAVNASVSALSRLYVIGVLEMPGEISGELCLRLECGRHHDRTSSDGTLEVQTRPRCPRRVCKKALCACHGALRTCKHCSSSHTARPSTSNKASSGRLSRSTSRNGSANVCCVAITVTGFRREGFAGDSCRIVCRLWKQVRARVQQLQQRPRTREIHARTVITMQEQQNQGKLLIDGYR